MVYPSEENVCFSLRLTVFLVKVHFLLNYFSNLDIPFRGKCMFFTPFDCFPRKGALFFKPIFQI